MIKNAIVMMFDSLQFNYVGCYGNDWIKTPNMDRLAREGVVFENAYTEGLPTVPCRRAMHTGRFTLPDAGWIPLRSDDTTIADLCWGRPIDTALVFDCPNYRLPKFGYTRGFDKVWYTHGHEADESFYSGDPLLHHNVEDYFEESTLKAVETKYGKQIVDITMTEATNFLKVRESTNYKRHVETTIPKAIEYLEQVDRNKQFFLWIDSFDPHEPWDPPSMYNPDMKCPYDPDYKGKDEFCPFPVLVDGVYTEEQCHHVRMLYAEIVTLCDTMLGKLLDAVRRLGFEQNTLFMMVSDHGEPFGEGKHGHGIMRKCRPWPYEELAHIPFIVRCPGVKAGQRIKAYVQSVDVAPTVCDWLGVGIHPSMQGKSLFPLMRGEENKPRKFAIAGYYPYAWAIYTDDWSYIHWNKAPSKFGALEMSSFYTESVDSGALKTENAESEVIDFRQDYENVNKAQQGGEIGLGNNNTLDGAAQWSCTPTASSEVPAEDELYDRKNDQFQLNNVIKQHPDVAKKLLMQLKDYMEELKG